MRKKIVFASLLSVVALGLTLAVVYADGSSFKKTESVVNKYTLTLDGSNCSFLPYSKGSGQSNATNSPKTIFNNSIVFAYNDAIRSNNSVGTLYGNTGWMGNVTALSGLYSITVNYDSGQLSLAYGSEYSTYVSQVEVTSGVRYEINKQSHFKLSTLGAVNAHINSIIVEYSCLVPDTIIPSQTHVHHGYHYLAKEATADKPGNKEFYACVECDYLSLVKEDNGEYTDTLLAYELDSSHIAYLAPLYNLHNEYLRNLPQFPYPIAVDLELPNETYNIDNTGSYDCSTTIQQALNDLALSGGGTVYLPSGKYRLNNQLVVPNRVTLVGDFYGPDAGDYGTVFLCYKSHSGSAAVHEDSQVHLNSNTGINGITFYYPNQSVGGVTEYGYTISVRSNAAANISNLFFINSYNGITINNPTSGGGELCNIENIYGTCLKNGIVGYAQTDVGYWTNINLSPSYYANALSQYRCSDSDALYKYTRSNLTALTLGDLDDYGLDHINVDNAQIGIYFPEACVRATQAFWGFLNDVNLEDCVTGIICRGIYARGAALFTHSSLGCIINTSKAGMIKLAKSKWDKILGNGKTIIENGSENYEATPAIDDSNTYNIPNYLYYFDGFDTSGKTDISATLQAEINKIYTGGLIVLKNGTYRLDNPITIPDNTMIASFASSYSRSASGEGSNETVKFISYSNDACVKLGNYSGINGIRIYNAYRDITTAYNKLNNSQSDSFVSVKGIGNHSFAINTEASFTFTGFDFSNVSNHYIKYCYGGIYQTFIKAGGNGKIIASLTNMSFLSRCSLPSFAVANNGALDEYSNFESDSTKQQFVREMLRDYATMININNSSDELVFNCFGYGLKCLMDITNSNVLAVNTSLDYLKDNNYCYVVNGGDVTIVNTFRVFGKSFNLLSGHLKVYGRFDFTMKRESYFDSSISTDDTYNPLPSSGLTVQNLSTCETTTGLSGASRNSTQKHGGRYSWRASNTTNPAIEYSFSAIDTSKFFGHGFLRIYIYCQNISRKGHDSTIELTSSGHYDDQEIYFDIDGQITKTGWNEVIIELTSGGKGSSTEFDRTNCNYFRFYALDANCYFYLDDIDFVYESFNTNVITINECETADNLTGAQVNDFSMDGKYCWKSKNTHNIIFSFTFESVDISSYMETGYLCFYLYCPDIDNLGTAVYVELTSAGVHDNCEITSSLINKITKDGWNEVMVPLSSMTSGSPGTTFNPTACNFFRFYTLNSNCNFYLDHIYIAK